MNEWKPTVFMMFLDLGLGSLLDLVFKGSWPNVSTHCIKVINFFAYFLVVMDSIHSKRISSRNLVIFLEIDTSRGNFYLIGSHLEKSDVTFTTTSEIQNIAPLNNDYKKKTCAYI